MSAINLVSPAFNTRVQEGFYATTEAEFIADNDHFASPAQTVIFQTAILDILSYYGGQASESDIRRELARGRYCNIHAGIPHFVIPQRFPLYEVLATLGFTVTHTSSKKTNRHTGTIVSL
jgi:hypothetical protein